MFQNITSNEIRSNDIAHRNGVKRKFRLTGDEVLNVNRTNERFAPKELTWCDADGF